MEKQNKTADLKEYKHQYYEKNKEHLYEKIKAHKQKYKTATNCHNLLSRLNNGNFNTVKQSTLDKYEVYFNDTEQKYKSKIFE
jgi:hypothetical protein